MLKKISGYIREIPSGDPELGVSVEIRKHVDDALVTAGGVHGGSTNPTTTDAVTGLFEWTCELSPGPVYVTATADSGAVKTRSGHEVMQSGEGFISDLSYVMDGFSTGIFAGVLNEFIVTKALLVITVGTGIANMEGRLFGRETSYDLTQGANAALAVRNDLVVFNQYLAAHAEAGKQTITLVPGTVSGVDPTINADATIFQLAIYRAALSIGGGTPTLTDLRDYSTVYVGPAAVDVTAIDAGGQLSTAAIAKVLKAPTSGTEPAFASLASTELSDWSETEATDGYVPLWSSGLGVWVPTVPPSTGISVSDTASIDMTLTGSVLSAAAIFGTTATTIAAGNHTHAASGAQTVSDTASIDLTLTGTVLSAAAIFGTTSTTIAAGNHTHAAIYVDISGDSMTGELIFTGNEGITFQGTTPTVAALSDAGSGATADIEGTDRVGKVVVTTGTGAAVGNVLRVTFAEGLADEHYAVLLTPADIGAAVYSDVNAYVEYGATLLNNRFDIWFAADPTDSTSYHYFYHVIPYEP